MRVKDETSPDAPQGSWTHYERIGVAEDATPEEIRRAYKKVVKDLHSDRRGGPYEKVFEDLTKNLNIARDVLLDPISRSRYNTALASERLRARREPNTQQSPKARGPEKPTDQYRAQPSGSRHDPFRAHANAPQNTASKPHPAPTTAPANSLVAFAQVFPRVEEHPLAHLVGASTFVAAAYLLILLAAWDLGGPLGALVVFVGVPVVGLLAPRTLRAKSRPRAALLARSLWIGPLALCLVSLTAQFVPLLGTRTVVGLEAVVNVTFVAAGLYPTLWLLSSILARIQRTATARHS